MGDNRTGTADEAATAVPDPALRVGGDAVGVAARQVDVFELAVRPADDVPVPGEPHRPIPVLANPKNESRLAAGDGLEAGPRSM